MSNILLKKLDQRINDETLTPEQRESACAVRDKILGVYEKREAMQHCPALCLMELARAAADGSDRVFRYVPRKFWRNKAFCVEAARVNDEALDWIPDEWKEDL
jgi:hypothetical protein